MSNGEHHKINWVNVIGAIIIPILLFTAISLRDQDRRIGGIEGNRFTSADATTLRALVYERPTREELESDLSEIKQLLRDLAEDVQEFHTTGGAR